MPRGPWQEEVGLIVVGASLGGLSAAIIAADRGCRTVVVERTKKLGGGAATESEHVAAAGSRFQEVAGIEDTPDRLADDVLAATRHQVEPGLARAVAAQGAPIVAWLADRCGAPITLLEHNVPRGHSAARLHASGERGGATLVAELTRAATRHARISVRMGAVAERLVRDEGGAVRGIGVRAERRGAVQAVGGRVLLACGGFVGDDALVAAHVPAVAELPYHGAARATGEALRLGGEVGAATRRLGSCLVTPLCATPGHLVVSAPLLELGAILVNQAGQRFADETAGSLPLAAAVRTQPGRVAYLLFDERILATARVADPFFAHVVLPRMGRRGTAAEDLARHFELDVEGLRRTLEDLAARAPSPGPGAAALEPPLHAIRVTGARWRTLGGLAVDDAARVLDGAGRPIEGLYAAGGAAAGLGGEGTEGLLPGTDALAALGLARLAALDVVAQAAADD